MGLVRAALKFGMELYAHMKSVSRDLYRFNDGVVGRGTAYSKSRVLHLFSVFVIKLKAVSVSLRDFFLTVSLKEHGIGRYLAGIGTEAHGTALS